jgi:2-beta-glucuronyltransferase
MFRLARSGLRRPRNGATCYRSAVPSAVIFTHVPWPQEARLHVHFLAERLVARGWDVLFVTARYGPRTARPLSTRNAPAGRIRPEPSPTGPGRLATTVTWHRQPRSLVVRLAASVTGRYRGGLPGTVRGRARAADLLVFDAGEPLAFWEAACRGARGRTIYWLTDIAEVIRPSAIAQAGAQLAMEQADLVAVSSRVVAASLPQRPNTRHVPFGIDPRLLDGGLASPYREAGPRAVFAGLHGLDPEAVAAMARLRPGVQFHIIGPFRDALPQLPNVHAHGPLPFEATLPYIAHADVALHPVSSLPAAASFSDTLKVMQYTACRLPIVAPSGLAGTRPNVIPYTPGDEASIAAAIDDALAFDRASFVPEGIRTWDEAVAGLLDAVGLGSRGTAAGSHSPT